MRCLRVNRDKCLEGLIRSSSALDLVVYSRSYHEDRRPWCPSQATNDVAKSPHTSINALRIINVPHAQRNTSLRFLRPLQIQNYHHRINDGSNISLPRLNAHTNTLYHNHAHKPELRLPTALLLPALLHPPTSRQHTLLTTSLVVRAHPILLPPPSHLHPLPHRRAPNPPLYKRDTPPQPLSPRRESHPHIYGLTRGR